jgi:hypothetical protein
MELNVGSAFGAAALAVIFGFGAAFWIGSRAFKIRESLGQRICAWIFTISLAIGLAGLVNEFVGMPIQGLQTNYQKVFSYGLFNSLIIPFIAWISYLAIKPRSANKAVNPPNLSNGSLTSGNERLSSGRRSPSDSVKIGTAQSNTSEEIRNLSEPSIEQWEAALIEYESEARNKGLWAKLYATHDANENLVRAKYIQTRASEMAAEEIRRNMNIRLLEEKRISARHYSDERCIEEGLFEVVEINGYTCQKLYNGHAAVGTPIRTIIYKSFEALEEAMMHHKRSGYFTDEGMLQQIRKV